MIEEETEEVSSEMLLKPNKDFVRSDNSISTTPSRDLDFCFKVVLKEATKEDRLVKQVFYTALSAYTTNPINLAINAPSGEGKTHVLMKVSDLFPDKDVQFIADMFDKAIFHKNGYLGIKDDDGNFENIEGDLSDLRESLDTKIHEFKKTAGNNELATKNELKKEIEKIQKQINSIRDKAVKVIDLNHKILIFLDTPKKEIFKALMSLLSHDKLAVEYHYVDTSSNTGIATKINVLVGWPAVIFAQAVDYTNHPRYQEIQRRFIVTNPRMDNEKYESAINLIIERNCIPDFVYQLKVVSDDVKDKSREIILNIRDDLLSISSTIKPGKNNTLIPYRHLISQLLLSKNRSAQDMTFVNRVLNLVGLLTNINIKKRPSLEIKPTFGSDSFRIPMALYSDLFESLSLINNSTGGIRPYVLDWYQNIFLILYGSKVAPNSKDRNGESITEESIAVTTQQLIEKTSEVMKKHYTSRILLTDFLYPLLNLGYIRLLA
ncbi:MAG: phage scaffolding protein [Candidatus Nitrosocosmicus sp.]|nr:phage scaffolding protein [Candidatus Nitrosocosmicus sp.]